MSTIPVLKGEVGSNTSFDAASSIFGTDLTGGAADAQKVTTFAVQVVVGTAAILRVRFFNSTSSTYATSNFGSDSNMAANAAYSFSHKVLRGYSINYEMSATITVKQLWVAEIF